MDRKAELTARLDALRAELGTVQEGPTEVYSRIVGYYRSVRNWNAGKREEYHARRTYGMPARGPASPVLAARIPEESAVKAASPVLAARIPEESAGKEASPVLAARAPAASAGKETEPVLAQGQAARVVGQPSLAMKTAVSRNVAQASFDLELGGGAAVALERGASRSGILVFTRKACPNCPPVKDYVTNAGLPAIFVDVDGEEGLALARRHGVLATPTVLGLDGEGRESFRACGLGELKARLPGVGTGAC